MKNADDVISISCCVSLGTFYQWSRMPPYHGSFWNAFSPPLPHLEWQPSRTSSKSNSFVEPSLHPMLLKSCRTYGAGCPALYEHRLPWALVTHLFYHPTCARSASWRAGVYIFEFPHHHELDKGSTFVDWQMPWLNMNNIWFKNNIHLTISHIPSLLALPQLMMKQDGSRPRFQNQESI